MIILESTNRILHECVASTLTRLSGSDPNAEQSGGVLPMDVKCCDFDGIKYRVLVTEQTDEMRVYFAMPFWDDLLALGVSDRLTQVFGDKYLASDDTEYNACIAVSLTTPPANAEQLAADIGLLKTYTLGAPFYANLKAVKDGQVYGAQQITLSEDTTCYIVSKPDMCTVVFNLHFREKSDQVIARVFLNAFAAAKQSTPVSFDYNPPKVVRDAFGINDPTGNVGFISFTVLPIAVKSDASIERMTNALVQFRSYISYHIKCSKTYFHSHMRARVKELLGILNRAKPESDDAKKKKTATGRTFKLHTSASK